MENAPLQFFMMGCTYALLLIIWLFTYVFFIKFLRSWMQKPTIERWFHSVTGSILILFGTKLALEK